MQALPEKDVKAGLATVPQWNLEGKEIVRRFEFKGFKDAIRFVDEVAVEAEKADHHPDILVQYNKVTLRLSTHDANGLTHRDFSLAQWADQFFFRY